MYEVRHPLTADHTADHTADVLRTAVEVEAYFTADKTAAPAKPARDLSPLDQMFAYYDAE